MYMDYSALNQLLCREPAESFFIRQSLFHGGLGICARLWFSGEAAMLLDGSLHLFGREDRIEPFLAELEPGKYTFFATPVRYLPLLRRYFSDLEKETDSGIYTLSEADFPRNQVEPLTSLELADVDLVDRHWEFRSDGSRDFFRRAIANNPSSAIHSNGQLAGWAVCYGATADMANLGSLRVLDNWRRQGLGRKLALDLAAKVLDWGKTPMVHIAETNAPSQKLSTSIGFRKHKEKVFWGSGIKK